MNKISIENAEKLSPQELVELIINNVPFNNIRSCLTNLEKTLPSAPVEIEEQSKPELPTKIVSSNGNDLLSLRNMCKDDPILIVETNKIVKNKNEPQVIYYAKSKKDNKYKKFSLDVTKFSKSTCTNLAEEEDIVCKATSEWIDEQLATGKNISEIRKVIEEYLSSGINMYITKCPNYSEIKIKLGMEQEQIPITNVDETLLSALELSKIYSPITDYLIYTQDRKENTFRVAYYDEGKKSWVTEDKDKSFIYTIKKSVPFSENTPNFRLREAAVGNLEINSPKYKNLSLIVKDLVKNQIKLPYEFLKQLLN